MKTNHRILSLISIATIAGSVSAQEYLLRIEGGPESIDLSAGAVTFTLDVIGDIFESQGREYMLGGSFSLEVFGTAAVESISWIPAAWSEFNIDRGYDGNGLYREVEFGQWEWDGWTPRAGSALGSRIGSFQITLAQQDYVIGDFHAALRHGTEHTLSSFNSQTGNSYYSTPDTLTFENFSTHVTPAPSALAMVMFAGLIGSRRKRGA